MREPGTKVEPERDRVEVHGRPIPGPSPRRYLMLHKPVGVLTTMSDPEGRRTVHDLLPRGGRLFPVGRLDADTSGLLVVTNDGELAHHLMHPRYGVEKSYRARLDRVPDGGQLRRLREGVEFEPGVTSAPAHVIVRSARPERVEIEITLHEGRHRQVRRMCEAVGLAVTRLHRARYGPLVLGPLPRGAVRELTLQEVRRLRKASARPSERGAPRSFGHARARSLERAPDHERPLATRPRTRSGAARPAGPGRRGRRPADLGQPAQSLGRGSRPPRGASPRPARASSRAPARRRGKFGTPARGRSGPARRRRPGI